MAMKYKNLSRYFELNRTLSRLQDRIETSTEDLIREVKKIDAYKLVLEPTERIFDYTDELDQARDDIAHWVFSTIPARELTWSKHKNYAKRFIREKPNTHS